MQRGPPLASREKPDHVRNSKIRPGLDPGARLAAFLNSAGDSTKATASHMSRCVSSREPPPSTVRASASKFACAAGSFVAASNKSRSRKLARSEVAQEFERHLRPERLERQAHAAVHEGRRYSFRLPSF